MAIACLGIVASGILSGVQVASMSSKLPGTLALIAAVAVFAAFIDTLLMAASLVVHACIVRAESPCALAKNLVVATAACGVVVMLLTVGTFASIDTVSIDLARAGGWFVADIAANAAMAAIAWRMAKNARPTAA